ncbi:MAG: ABC transporter ATP-binding protein [Saccharofermentanales bacterium]
MRKLARYLKPFTVGLLIAIVLLFIQAMADLNLPNYMSDIVNVGIQQNGIEHAAPQAISISGYKLMTTFMTAEEKALFEENYTQVSVTDHNDDGDIYASLYPDAVDGLYVRSDTSKDVLDSLDNTFGAATWTFINAMKDLSAQTGQQSGSSTPANVGDIDLTKLYAMQPMLDMLPEATISSAHEKAMSNDVSILKQSGIMLTKAFYTELGIDLNKMQTGFILRIGLLMLLIALLGGVATVIVSYFSSKIAAGVARNLRKDVFNKIENFSNNEFDKFSTASLITRCTNDVMQIQMLLMIGIRMLCYAPIMGIGGILMAVNKSVSMSWIIAVSVTVLLGLISIVMSIALPKFKIIQKLIDKLNLVSRENLSGLMVIRAFGTQAHETKRFEAANRDLTDTMLFVSRVMVFMMPAMMLIMNGVTLLVVWVGAHQIADSTMQVGDMMAFMQYLMQIIMSFLMISMMFIFLPRAAVSAERISEVLDTGFTIIDPPVPQPFDGSKKGLVEFRDVHFRYLNAEEDAVCSINFTAQPGQTTAIIGSTGSGKSTLVNLILRFYDVTEGQVLVDGVDIRNVRQKDLRAKIGYIPQKGVLISGTIASNLRYGNKDASAEELETAARVSQAMEFIAERAAGFESEISQGGGNVSGGQKQRLSIARALAKNPEIFIFDDSFSALDFKTDLALRKALKEHTGDSTVIVVAQRISTIMNAEHIIVLEEGRIAGSGTHKELLESCPEYFEIASSQLSKEELA